MLGRVLTTLAGFFLGAVCFGAVCAKMTAAVEIVSATTRNFLNKFLLLFIKISALVY